MAAPAPEPTIAIPSEPIPCLETWLKHRDDAGLKAAAVKHLNRLGVLTVYVDGQGYSCATRAFRYRPQAGHNIEVPHPAPARGQIAVVPVAKLAPLTPEPTTAADALD